MEQCDVANHSQMKPVVVLGGTASEATVGPAIGVTDIGISDDAFLFRVALPGIRKNESKLKFEILYDGTVTIQGLVTPASGILTGSTNAFRMIVEQLPPAGPFTVSFKLPGPVDPRLVSLDFRADGILEGVVMKQKVNQCVAGG